MNIAIIGAGNVGGGLGRTFAKAGLSVKFGVKPDGDTKAIAEVAPCVSVKEAAKWADVVFMAVPGSVALDVTRDLADELAGKVLVDCNNPLTWKEGPVWNPPPEGSLAQAMAKAAPNARVVKGFNQFGAEFHANPHHAGGSATVFLAADDAKAKIAVSDIAKKAGFDPVDAGPLRNASVLENVAMLWIHLALVGGQGRDFAFAMARAK